MSSEKSPDAFRTIGELSRDLGVAQHILRYWEGKFPQLRPLQRAGNRRYYRPADIALANRINRLLNHEGYTVRGVQKLLGSQVPDEHISPPSAPPAEVVAASNRGIPVERLRDLRDRLRGALAD